MKLLTRIGLVLVVPLAAACVTSAGATEQTVAVNIHHSRFRPTTFEYAAGTTVTFVIRNGDPIDHEFILGDRAVQRRHELGTHAKHDAVPGEVSIPAGETRTTTYTFDEPGTLTIGCHLPAHYAYGMRAEVKVTR
jgi:uncharacterized cupredoxin-like copper-binding protein